MKSNGYYRKDDKQPHEFDSMKHAFYFYQTEEIHISVIAFCTKVAHLNHDIVNKTGNVTLRRFR